MEQSPFWEADSRSDTQEIHIFCISLRFVAVFTKTRQ
jgi:hypothetical protein